MSMIVRVRESISVLISSSGVKRNKKRARQSILGEPRMPKGHRMKLFRLVLTTERTDYVITNDMTQDDADVVKQHCGIRWKIEQFHREAKQVTGLEGCQCRLSRALRNHIACSFLVWERLKRLAQQLDSNVYRLKFSLLDEYMRQQLKSPSISMVLRA